MKKGKILKTLTIAGLCLGASLGLAGCGNKPESNPTDIQIREVYAMAVSNGYTGTYEEWLESIKGEKGDNIELRVYNGYIQWKTTSSTSWQNLISLDSLKGDPGLPGTNGKTPTITISDDGYWVINGVKSSTKAVGEQGSQGEKGSVVTIGSDGYWYIDGVKTNVKAQGQDGQDATYNTYTITYDYGAATDFFNNVQETKTIKSTEWLTGMPTIKAEYKDVFLGWFVKGSDTQIKEYNFIGGNATLEARFDITQAPSGLYKNGKYVKKWSDIKEEYPNAFSGTTIVCRSNDSSYFPSLSGDLVIDNEITSIGRSAFYYCTSLTSVVIPNSVTSIGRYAFYGCTSLSNIEVNENNEIYKSIDGNLYNKAGTELIQYAIGKTDASFTIPDSVTSIGECAFHYCTSLTSVVIPNSVTSIELEAFSGTSLTSVVIPDSVTSIGLHAFSYCTNLTSVVIPNSVTSIGRYAFYKCTSLTSVVIPDSVTSIGVEAFSDCTSLSNIEVDENNETYKSIDGNLYNKAGTELIQYAIGKTDTSFTIPDSVTSIEDYAFSYCTSLTSVVIPNSVTSIGYGVFSDCTSLTSVVIPDSVTSIGIHAFYKCTSLTSVVIPDSVTSIGQYAFYGCTSLTSVYYTGTEVEWNNISIDSNTELINATRYYYTEIKPTENDKYWHYVDGVPTVWTSEE